MSVWKWTVPHVVILHRTSGSKTAVFGNERYLVLPPSDLLKYSTLLLKYSTLLKYRTPLWPPRHANQYTLDDRTAGRRRMIIVRLQAFGQDRCFRFGIFFWVWNFIELEV